MCHKQTERTAGVAFASASTDATNFRKKRKPVASWQYFSVSCVLVWMHNHASAMRFHGVTNVPFHRYWMVTKPTRSLSSVHDDAQIVILRNNTIVVSFMSSAVDILPRSDRWRISGGRLMDIDAPRL